MYNIFYQRTAPLSSSPAARSKKACTLACRVQAFLSFLAASVLSGHRLLQKRKKKKVRRIEIKFTNRQRKYFALRITKPFLRKQKRLSTSNFLFHSHLKEIIFRIHSCHSQVKHDACMNNGCRFQKTVTATGSLRIYTGFRNPYEIFT